MDKMQKNFKSIHSVVRDQDYILISYRTKAGNIGQEDGSLSSPHARLAWLIERAKEVKKL